MLCSPAFIYAQPPAYLAVVRDDIERLIERHNASETRHDARADLLAMLQAAVNGAIEAQGVDVPPLLCSVKGGDE